MENDLQRNFESIAAGTRIMIHLLFFVEFEIFYFNFVVENGHCGESLDGCRRAVDQNKWEIY